ncbi:uncharacterized protein BX664DRAFT_329977 [Halteromyces radiatus]|uniref:uncharacterized protein n=1 Tax=Halteromyces radiatus TaxID=101107 RepID=UPI00222090A1|nr:uncharacterized protein BX664DRAFT_329977 [Halteromyces radiatus]KAI8093561.1 hypothetical protein BX664DRAFT_329977 [Halteromyces radiatus]
MFLPRRTIRSCLKQKVGLPQLSWRLGLWILLFVLIIIPSLYTIDLNLHVSLKPWIHRQPSVSVDSLTSSCFQSPYTIKQLQSPPITPGIPLKNSDECLGFASSIGDSSLLSASTQRDNVWFHTYWIPSNDNMEDHRLGIMLRSFAATHSQGSLMIWVQDGHENALLHSNTWRQAKQHMKGRLEHNIWTTIIDRNNKRKHISDQEDTRSEKMDYIGLLILQQYGGVWFHPSIVFLRSWAPLLGTREWMIQQDCQATHSGQEAALGSQANNHQQTVMHFFANSSILCQLVETMEVSLFGKSSSSSSSSSSTGLVYKDVYHRLMKAKIRPWLILPWCFMNAAGGCTANNLDLFNKPTLGIPTLPPVFALQYNVRQWVDDPDTLLGLLDLSHQAILGW